MSNCQIRIEISNDQRVFKVGDRIDCIVHVSVDKKVKCKGLLINLGWHTHGRGNIDQETMAKRVLFKGEWQPGEYQYPCHLDVVPGPVSYHGHYINIDWELTASADIPWAFDPKTSIELVVEPDQHADNKPLIDTHADENSLEARIPSLVKVIVPSIFILIGVLMIYYGWDGTEGILFAMGLGFVFLGSVLGAIFIRNVLALKKLGNVNINLSTHRVRPGDAILVNLDFTPRSNVKVNKIKAELIGKEVAVSGSGTNRTTHTHRLHISEYNLSPAREFEAGMPCHCKTTIPIPTDAPYSFSASDNNLKWEIEFHIDIDNWPDWCESRVIKVIY